MSSFVCLPPWANYADVVVTVGKSFVVLLAQAHKHTHLQMQRKNETKREKVKAQM